MYRLHGCGFIVGHDSQSEVSPYSARHTPGYDNSRIHGKILLSVCTCRRYSDSYFGVITGRIKVCTFVKIVMSEKKKVVEKKEKDGDEECIVFMGVDLLLDTIVKVKYRRIQLGTLLGMIIVVY